MDTQPLTKDILCSHFDDLLGAGQAEQRRVLFEAALGAGDLLMAHFRQPQQVKQKEGKDFTTAVDGQAETLIKGIIGRDFPDHSIMGEEQGLSGQAEYQWVVDPIDGTFNYTFGLAHFAVSIALVRDGRTLLGAVYDPAYRELFFAQRGQGAWLDLTPIHVSDRRALGDALVGLDLTYEVSMALKDVARLTAVIPAARAVRLLGSAALELAAVACGRLDVFFHSALSPWDWAAGGLLVEEAGGRITDPDGIDLPGPRLATQSLVATNGYLHEAIRRLPGF